jgi:hypothetical protein
LQVRPHVAGLGCPYGWGAVNDLPDSPPGRVALPPRCVHLDRRLGEPARRLVMDQDQLSGVRI